jgi:hypothetical protein
MQGLRRVAEAAEAAAGAEVVAAAVAVASDGLDGGPVEEHGLDVSGKFQRPEQPGLNTFTEN